MIDIANIEEVKKYDPKNVYGSTEMFVKQCKQIHETIEKDFESCINPYDLKNINSIVFSGMGGSAYGGHVAMNLFKEEFKVPTYLNSDYYLPLFVDCDSLVLLTSYSGSTEETLTSFDDAKTRNAYIIGLTTGGKLAEYLNDNGKDAVVFDPKYNPSGQPRLGTGYIVLGTIGILRKLSLISSSLDIENAIDETEKNSENIKRAAMDFAKQIYGFIPIIFAGNFLAGNAHIIRNQFNETAKSFASYHVLPEANHHVMEGLKNPANRKLVSLFLNSPLYTDRIRRRLQLTQEVVEKNNMGVLTYNVKGKTKLSQVLEVLMLGGYLTFYLAILYKQDPSLIPWVDYFKEQLAK